MLGVDTIVALGARIYGKPVDRAAAVETLRALAGRRHAVISGLCLIEPGPDGRPRTRSAAARTVVEFRALDDAAIDWYVETGEWRERAGGYAIQGRGALLVRAIEGDYLNVVGLPVATLVDLAPWLVGVRARWMRQPSTGTWRRANGASGPVATRSRGAARCSCGRSRATTSTWSGCRWPRSSTSPHGWWAPRG